MSDPRPVVPEPQVPAKPIAIGAKGVQLSSFEDLWRFAVAVKASGLAPQTLNTAEKILIAMQTGLEAGLTPMASLRSVYVVNGLPAWYGSAALALIRAHPQCRLVKTWVAGEGDERAGYFATRRGNEEKETVYSFSVAQAKKAGLWGKGAWSSYPDDLLIWRAVARGAKQHWSDVLLNLPIAEEAMDYPAPEEREVRGRVVELTPRATDPLFDEPSAGSESPPVTETNRSGQVSEPAPDSGVGAEEPPGPGCAEAESEGAAPVPEREVPVKASGRPGESDGSSRSEGEKAGAAPASWREDPRFTKPGDDGPMSPIEQQQLVDLMAERKMQLSWQKTAVFLGRIVGRNLKRPGELTRAEFYRIVAVLKPAALPKERRPAEDPGLPFGS